MYYVKRNTHHLPLSYMRDANWQRLFGFAG
jgi:hypothetical protein